MEVIRYKYIFVLVSILFNLKYGSLTPDVKQNSQIHSTTNCPYTKIIEDIFKIHNRTSNAIYLKDKEKAKIFLNSIANVTTADDDKKTDEQELVDHIIASINRIKNNLTTKSSEETKLNEAIILSVPESKNASYRRDDAVLEPTKPEQKGDSIENNTNEKVDNKSINLIKQKIDQDNLDSIKNNTDKAMYVEILTVEPNNTASNQTSNNIIEVLKHLMPIFNNTLNKGLHNITIIEKNQIKNHSYSTSKNISTIVVTYCDKENFTKANVSFESNETNLKMPGDRSDDYEYSFEDASGPDDENYDDKIDMNMTIGEKRDLLEAAEYGMQKMHELYTVLEPKLYSMGLWLDDASPARYVAAFNAPSEDVARYSRYGYASVQAAARLKELTGGDNDGLEGRTEETQAFPISALRQSPLQQQCPLKGAPKCPPASKRYRTHDGTCNNLNRPRWGSTMTPVQRFLPPSYSDGIQAPRRSVTGFQLPSAREISALVHEDQNVENPGITHLLMQWGQFLDHDVTSSSQSRGFNGSVPRCCKDGGRDFVPQEFLHPECFPIPVPASDPFYGPRGIRCLDFVRSSPAPRDDCALGWREQLNQVSAYIDGSPLYASSARQSDKLRLFRNGMLQYGRVQQRRPLLPPERKDELCRGGAVSTDCFKSGDARVNEHPGLVAAHIVWLRQHNRMAQELAHLNPHWSDEKIYQETRKIIGAMIQHITYREFLPIVLGSDVMRLFELEPQQKGFFRGYDPKTNASPASAFGSAAFRFGHSLVQPSMMRYDRFHRPMHNNVSLHDEITNPSNIWSVGAVDRLLLGMVNQPIQKRDEFMTAELTNHLFQTPALDFGMDLAAINVQRGRDHGAPPYAAWREPCGLSPLNSFQDLFRVMPARAVRKLQTLYRSIDDIDLFTGGMAERPVVGGLVGPTFACIIAQQFSNLRKGDRFWYENGGFDSSFTPAQLQQIRRISFAQVLCHTLDSIDNIQPFVFLSPDNPDNGRISCNNGLLNDFNLSPWVEINSDFNNDISKTDNQDILSTDKPTTRKPKPSSSKPKPSTQRPKRTKPPTTVKPASTTKKTEKVTAAAANKVTQKIPTPANFTNYNKLTDKPNKTSTTVKDKINNTLTTDKTTSKPQVTVQNIDDKLDFKNKSLRYEDSDRIDTRDTVKSSNKQYGDDDYEEDENVQSVQSVVINNLAHRPQRPSYNNHNNRPYNYNNNNYNDNKRPVITVTENINKYTYLINYVPRPTESWRRTTRRTYDRDVVKVTYQNYDDTYRRPSKPQYYNRDEYDQNYDNSNRRDGLNFNTDKDNIQSSARSNDDTMTTPKPKDTIDKSDKIDHFNPTTENLYKLVTFGYVGTYKGDTTNDKQTPDLTDKETISKDFSTYDNVHFDNDKEKTNTKLSTFFLYDTVTKPYSSAQRPTRRNDDDNHATGTKTKYYYIKNVLHKLSEGDSTGTITEKDIIRENYNSPGVPVEDIEERSSVDKLAFLEEAERAASGGQQRVKVKKPANSAKTPSVAFQVIPSENNPSQWAVYDEKELPEGLPHRMPSIHTDPHALKEIPRPMTFGTLRRKRPWRF